MSGLWDVWRVSYRTYAEIDAMGDEPPRLIRANLPLGAASKLVEQLGFGHCMKPCAAASLAPKA